MLFYDLIIATGNLVADFCQGAELLGTDGLSPWYGAITIAICWIPGKTSQHSVRLGFLLGIGMSALTVLS